MIEDEPIYSNPANRITIDGYVKTTDEEMVRVIDEHPGITIKEIQKILNINSLVLRRILRQKRDERILRSEGIEKDNKWYVIKY